MHPVQFLMALDDEHESIWASPFIVAFSRLHHAIQRALS